MYHGARYKDRGLEQRLTSDQTVDRPPLKSMASSRSHLFSLSRSRRYPCQQRPVRSRETFAEVDAKFFSRVFGLNVRVALP